MLLKFKDMQGSSGEGGGGGGAVVGARGQGCGDADAGGRGCGRGNAGAGGRGRGRGAGAAGQSTRWDTRRVQAVPEGELDAAGAASADYARRAAESNSRAERMERRVRPCTLSASDTLNHAYLQRICCCT